MGERILGVDYGLSRIGFAVSDADGLLATPLSTVAVDSEKQALRAIRTVVADEKIDRVVIGLPLTAAGEAGIMVDKVRAFAQKMKRCGLPPVEEWDERFTSAEAERALHAGGLSAKQQRGLVDQLAAQLMLQNYLDARQFSA